MDQMGSVNAEIEEFFEENPLVPIDACDSSGNYVSELAYEGELLAGALMTAGVLTAGLISFRQGNSHLGQKLMRARVVVQGATVALMVGTAYYYGEKF
ncbi:RING-H2 finger protein ATL48 [Sesamum angolense]|uniref:RING-H2 finger protein ATL48 n=1 Tax=Sesamum angolense TaxID=2727404 RepID=A0AAE1WDA6_9LAMI|nr:RING-H2 finger protein ATL48 [Sesamum angolense]